jgi:hypothetical protein
MINADVFYTVVIYDLIRDRIDYEYSNLFEDLNVARSFAACHSSDDEFTVLVAKHDISDLSIVYV